MDMFREKNVFLYRNNYFLSLKRQFKNIKYLLLLKLNTFDEMLYRNDSLLLHHI